MAYDKGLANRLRAVGLRVVEVDGWQTRGGSELWAGGSVNHHTAGPPSGATPSLNTCINGRPDLDGPLCNVFQSREPDGRDIAYVVAAGRANHAGSGGWKGLSGNASVYGLEIEHTGTDPFPSARLDIAARIHAAMFGGDPSYCCAHREWTDRKIDVAEGVDDDDFRRRITKAREGEEDMGLTPEERSALDRAVRASEAAEKASEAALAKANEISDRQVPEQTVRDDIVLNREIAATVGAGTRSGSQILATIAGTLGGVLLAAIFVLLLVAAISDSVSL